LEPIVAAPNRSFEIAQIIMIATRRNSVGSSSFAGNTTGGDPLLWIAGRLCQARGVNLGGENYSVIKKGTNYRR
jgi:hypothetical protein